MTATEKARRAESLYQDRAKRELADMVVHREADLEDAKAESEHMRLKALAVTGKLQEENERLKADNAKLMETLQRRIEQFEGMTEMWAERGYKNFKLRELVEDMLDCIQIRAAFSRPPTEEMYEMFYKRARELGVDE